MPSHANKRRIAVERRVFNKTWTAKYLFTEVGGKAVCLACGEQIAVFKKYNLNRHYQTKHAENYKHLNDAERARASEALLQKRQGYTSCPIRKSSLTNASFLISYNIAKECRLFSDGEFIKECMVKCAEILFPEEKEAFEQVALTRQIVTKRIMDIAGNLELQLQRKVASFDFFSLGFAKSCDVCDGTAKLLIFVRGITSDFKIMEELAATLPIKETANELDLFMEVSVCVDALGLNWDRLASVTNFAGQNAGLLKHIQDKVMEIDADQRLVILHCIINQHMLCKSVLQINHVVDVVTEIVNFIKAQTWDHRQFDSLFDDELSLGNVLKRVWDLKAEIQESCEMKGKDVPELSDKDWMSDFAFAVDVTALLNELNTQLQAKGLLVHEMHDQIKASMTKMQLLSNQLESNTPLTHMQTLQEVTPSADCLRRYSSMLEALLWELSKQFDNLDTIEDEMDMVSSPFTCNAHDVPGDAQLELIDLQCNYMYTTQWRLKSQSLLDFYTSLNERDFPNIRRHAQKISVLFGSTYLCERTFSLLKLARSTYGPFFADEHLSAVLRISTSEILPEFDTLVNKDLQNTK